MQSNEREAKRKAKARLFQALRSCDFNEISSAISSAQTCDVAPDIIQEAKEELRKLKRRSSASEEATRFGTTVGEVAATTEFARADETTFAVTTEFQALATHMDNSSPALQQKMTHAISSASMGTWCLPKKRSATFFMHAGQRYNSLDELCAAVGSAPRRKIAMSRLGKEIKSKTCSLFRTYAGAQSALPASQFWGLTASLAAEFGIDPRGFGDMSAMFDDFDVNCNGVLEEHESVRLAKYMMRHYIGRRQASNIGTIVALSSKSQHLDIGLGFVELELKYEVDEKAGEGGQAAVFLAREIDSGHVRAVKCYSKQDMEGHQDDVKDECNILKCLDHPAIQRVYEMFEDRLHIYIVVEPLYGGHVGQLVDNAYKLGIIVTSTYLAKVAWQVVQGIAYLHSQLIIHCDLKEDNVMIASGSREELLEPSPVIIDFGLAMTLGRKSSVGGTLGFAPPELWTRGQWTPKGDIHCLGVIFFQIFAMGERAFRGANDRETHALVMTAMPRFQAISNYWGLKCDDLISLLEAMLSKKPGGRPHAKKILEDPFFTSRLQFSGLEEDEQISTEVLDCLGSVADHTSLQRAIMTDIAARLNLLELHALNDSFRKMDANGNGVVTAEECRQALDGLLDKEALEQAVTRLVGPLNELGYTAFMGRLLTSKEVEESRLLWKEFRQLDIDGTGYLDQGEVALLLERPALAKAIGKRDVSALMDIMDRDGDGEIVFEEFRRALNV